MNEDPCATTNGVIEVLPNEELRLAVVHDGSSPNENYDEFCEENPDNLNATFVWSSSPPLPGLGSSIVSNPSENGFVFPEVVLLNNSEENYVVCLEGTLRRGCVTQRHPRKSKDATEVLRIALTVQGS